VVTAPSQRFVDRYSYTDIEWNAIAEALDHLGDADFMVVWGDQESYHVPGCDVEPPLGYELPPGRVMLRTALQRLVVFSLVNAPPRRPSRATLHNLMRKTEDLRALAEAAGLHSPELAHLAQSFEQQQWMQTHRPRNRHQPERNRLLAELHDFWIEELEGHRSGARVERFLKACMEPVFGPVSTRAIRAWLERYHAGQIRY
jgi:hypothetical protein